MMSDAEYLRGQAAHCLSLARACFDLSTAQQLRLLAGEFMDRARELDTRFSASSRSGFSPCLVMKSG